MANLVGGPESTGRVLVEGSQRGIGGYGALIGNSPGVGINDLVVRICVGMKGLPEGEVTVDVHVMEPEDWVVRCEGEVGHVSSGVSVIGNTTSQRVDGVVDSLQAIGAIGRARVLGRIAEMKIITTLSHERVDLLLQTLAIVFECIDDVPFNAVCAGAVATGPADGVVPLGEVFVIQIGGIGKGVFQQRIVDGCLTVLSIDGLSGLSENVGEWR